MCRSVRACNWTWIRSHAFSRNSTNDTELVSTTTGSQASTEGEHLVCRQVILVQRCHDQAPSILSAASGIRLVSACSGDGTWSFENFLVPTAKCVSWMHDARGDTGQLLARHMAGIRTHVPANLCSCQTSRFPQGCKVQGPIKPAEPYC